MYLILLSHFYGNQFNYIVLVDNIHAGYSTFLSGNEVTCKSFECLTGRDGFYLVGDLRATKLKVRYLNTKKFEGHKSSTLVKVWGLLLQISHFFYCNYPRQVYMC